MFWFKRVEKEKMWIFSLIWVMHHWREFKMLHHQVNGCPIDANDLVEVVQVLYSFSILTMYCPLTYQQPPSKHTNIPAVKQTFASYRWSEIIWLPLGLFCPATNKQSTARPNPIFVSSVLLFLLLQPTLSSIYCSYRTLRYVPAS